jgi:hypothetical protein
MKRSKRIGSCLKMDCPQNTPTLTLGVIVVQNIGNIYLDFRKESSMDNQCFKCGTDGAKPGCHWFVRGSKLYFCAHCYSVLDSNRGHPDLFKAFMADDWREKVEVSPELGDIIDARVRRAEGKGNWM